MRDRPNGENGTTALIQARATLRSRLEARRPELEQAVLDRARAIADPAEVSDPAYAEALRLAIAAALDYALDAIERGEQRAPPPPPALLVQARIAARNGVEVETVLRRYFAGYSLLTEFVIHEAEDGGLLHGAGLQHLLSGQAAVFDRLIAAVSKEYAREAAGRLASTEQRRADRIKRLLAGELIDATELSYELEACHLGMVAQGPGSAKAIRNFAALLGKRLLMVEHEDGVVWGWLGSQRGSDPVELERLHRTSLPPQVCLAIGEPAEGLAGWRLTHRQAAAALPIALRQEESLIRYADVALITSVLRDELLVTSLTRLYLTPLTAGHDNGAALLSTLRAYFAAGRNVSSAASALGASRQTVRNRLRAVEERVGCTVDACAVDLEVALRLHSTQVSD